MSMLSSTKESKKMESELTLDKAVAQVRQSELVKKQQGSLRSEALKEVETVSSKSRASVSKGQSQRPYKGKSRMPGDNRFNKYTRCGRTPAHSRQQCPARDEECYNCHNKGHFRSMCRSKSSIRAVATTADTESSDEF